MKGSMTTKIKMYHEVEKVCSAYHASWNISEGFASLFTRFVSKLTRLDQVYESTSDHQLIELMVEIDSILNNSLDALVSALRPKDTGFYDTYRTARIVGQS